MTKQQADKPQRRKIIRPVSRQLDDATIQADIRARCPMGSPFFDWLTEIRLEDITFNSEFDRGTAEGMRRLARQIQDYVLAEQE